MALKGNTNAEKVWNYLIAAGLTKHGAAGLMGNLQAESGLNPKNLQNSYEKKLGYTDDSYTAAVDNGSYTNFVKDSAGYGLAQWTYWTRKQKMLDFAKSHGKSIGDLEMQLNFMMSELAGYSSLLTLLMSAASVKAASDAVLLQYERPADMGEGVKNTRASYGQKFFNQFAGTASAATTPAQPTGETEAAIRKKVVGTAVAWLGRKEADGSHRVIIDTYNSHKPLVRNYAVKYTDAWCATFVSAVAVKTGLTDIIPLECGCGQYVQLAQKAGIWVENDAYVPAPGDIILYDWQDSGAGDNTGWPDHIGIIVSVSGGKMKIIEGNISDSVGYRTIAVNGRYIRGFVTPKYASKATATEPVQRPTPSPAATGENEVKAREYAKSFDKALAGTYTTTAGLNLRGGAGTNKAKLTVIPSGGKVQNYGYFSKVNGVRWLYVQYSNGGTTYTGFCSGKYLDKDGAAASAPAYTTYTVKKGESLWAIAQRILGNGNCYPEIKSLNGLTSNTIYAGTVLKIPAK